MTTHGVIECRIAPATLANTYNEVFIAIYNFLSSATAQSIGITRIANNFGSAGTGMGYWDSGTPAGHNAWALFQFGNATIPFYVLIQYTAASNFGSSPGNPGLNDGGTGNGVAIAVAMLANGSSPWNGTTNNNGADTKGSSVWVPGSDVNTGQLFITPRSNAGGGTHVTPRNNMMSLTPTSLSTINRLHCIVDEDNIVILYDGGNDNSYRFFFFGKYTPRTGLIPRIPYCSIRSSTEGEGVLNAGVYGTTGGSSTYEGGIAVINATAPISGSCFIATSGLSEFWTTSFQPNTIVPQYDEFLIHVGLSENPHLGYLGTVDFLRWVFNVQTHDTNTALTRMVWGNATAASLKTTVPWDGATTPGTGLTRAGVIF